MEAYGILSSLRVYKEVNISHSRTVTVKATTVMEISQKP